MYVFHQLRMEDLDRNLSSAVPMPGGVIIGKYCDISNLVEHPVPVYPPTHRRQHQAIPVMLTKKVRRYADKDFACKWLIGNPLEWHKVKRSCKEPRTRA